MLIIEHSSHVIQDSTTYEVRICGEERRDGTWSGWLEFYPSNGSLPVLATEQETSQPSQSAFEYWASGLEPAYLEGALARAEGHLP